MKRSVLAIIVSALILLSSLVWLFNSASITWGENIQLIIIMVIVAFGLYFAYRRLTSVKRGEPAEDEYSRKVLQKAAALSFYISIYLWLVIMYLTDKFKPETDVMFGWGILGMAVIFALSWVYFNFRGIRNE
ncbi:MAG: DUF2178 domain-containing protein [Bacteroidales bacterium]|nr:DUF2178 domain-containing protein [Bacteroidales bacterium]